MKKFCNLLFSAVVALLLFGVTSCSDSKTKELLSVAGDDAVAVVMINPVQVLKSLDATFENGQVTLPSSLKKLAGDDVKQISKLRGIVGLARGSMIRQPPGLGKVDAGTRCRRPLRAER